VTTSGSSGRGVKASSVKRGALGGFQDLARAATTTRVNPWRLVGAGLRYGPHFGALLAASARRFGPATALIDEFGSMSYTDLWLLASSLDLGAEPVAIRCGDNRWLLAGVAGAALGGADVTLLGPHAASATGHARVLGHTELEAARAPASSPGRRVPSLTLMTTGSTGAPKPVERKRFTAAHVLPAASLVAALGLRPGEPVLILPPLFHGHGFSLAAACLLVGAPIILGPTASAVSLVRQHSVGLIAGVPAQLAGLVGEDLAPVRLVAAGSARLPSPLAAALLETVELVDFFGSTETGTATIARAADLRAGTVGRPAAGVRLSIVDDAGVVVPRGDEGWVTVRSALSFAGRSRLRTGDRGSLDHEGRLTLTGRADGVIVSGGENLNAHTLRTYIESQPEVDDAHVTVVHDERLDSALAARVVLNAPLTASALCERVRAEIGRHYVPRDLVIERASGAFQEVAYEKSALPTAMPPFGISSIHVLPGARVTGLPSTVVST